MLALLEEVPGVAVSRVDWTGKRFLLQLDADAEIDEVVPQADEVIGGDARRLARDEEAGAIAGFRRGERWMRSGETSALSREEARVLAERHGRQSAQRAGLDQRKTDLLVRALEQELAAAFDRIHARGEGLPSDFETIYGEVVERTLEKSRAFLDEDEHRRLVQYAAEFSATR